MNRFIGNTLTYKVHFKQGGAVRKTRRELEDEAIAACSKLGRLLAAAHHFEKLLNQRLVKNMAELARNRQISRTRIMQIMNLLCLAPDIQEEILGLDHETTIGERHVRPIAQVSCWTVQRRMWRILKQSRLKS